MVQDPEQAETPIRVQGVQAPGSYEVLHCNGMPENWLWMPCQEGALVVPCLQCGHERMAQRLLHDGYKDSYCKQGPFWGGRKHTWPATRAWLHRRSLDIATTCGTQTQSRTAGV